MSHFQFQPLKCSAQDNEISTCSLWCLRNYGVAYQIDLSRIPTNNSAESRSGWTKNTANLWKCPPQPRSGAIVRTHWSGMRERSIAKLKPLVVSRACGFKNNYMLHFPWVRWLVWKIHGNKSCVRVWLVNIYRQQSVLCEYCRGCLKETLQMVSQQFRMNAEGGQGGEVLSRSHDTKFSISRIKKQKIHFSRFSNMCTKL